MRRCQASRQAGRQAGKQAGRQACKRAACTPAQWTMSACGDLTACVTKKVDAVEDEAFSWVQVGRQVGR